MNIIRLAGELFLLYILYKLIFDFIIPIYVASKKVKNQFGEMQSKMQEQMNQYNRQNSQQPQSPTAPKTEKKKEEYIDYEEVKTKKG
jgi:hypothetical protein